MVKRRGKSKQNIQTIRPHPGPQEAFLSTSADIAIFGGAAGAGKSFSLLMEPIRYIKYRGFTSVCFRRQSTQVTSAGGLWDTSFEFYDKIGGTHVQTPKPKWKFPSGATISFGHLQYEKSVKEWDGSQIGLLLFDELQHFTETQWWYMMSRNRSSVPGVKACVRASCNPDPDSWLRHFLGWWIDQDTGFPIVERGGKIRWMVRYKGEVTWADSKEELLQMFDPELVANDEILPLSVTFIPGTIDDNPTLLVNNPQYRSNLSSMFEYERQRLLLGNWFARPTSGELFKRHYWQYIDVIPKKWKKLVRYWDMAGTLPSDSNPDPDWTAGALVGLDKHDKIVVLDMVRFRAEPGEVMDRIHATAVMDQKAYPEENIELWLEQDPGQAGKAEVHFYKKELKLFDVRSRPKRTNKLTYWRPFAVQAKKENVYLVGAPWNHAFVSEGEAVVDGSQPSHDDQMDASSGGFMVLMRLMQQEVSNVISKLGGL